MTGKSLSVGRKVHCDRVSEGPGDKSGSHSHSHTHSHTHSTDSKYSDISTQMKQSINRIQIFRVVLLCALVGTGLLSATLSYVILERQEDTKYKSEFRSLIHEINVIVDQGFQSRVITLDHMSTISSFNCPHAHQWPNCSISKVYFEALTDSLLDVSNSRSISSNPIIYPHQQESFETFAYELFERDEYPEGTGLSSFGEGLFGKNADGTRYADDGKTNFSNYELFVPVFQPADLQNNWRGIMYNMVGLLI